MNTYSVLLNPNEVDQRGSTGYDNKIEETKEPVNLNENHESGDDLNHPVEHVELHCHKISLLSSVPSIVTYTTNCFVLLTSKPAKYLYLNSI